jgi:hypothetical protein
MNMEPTTKPAITGTGSRPFTLKETDVFGFCCRGLARVWREIYFEFYASSGGARRNTPRPRTLEPARYGNQARFHSSR